MENQQLKSSSIKITRNSSIEILRITAMMMIVISHFVSHGINDFSPIYELKPCFNKYLLECIGFGNLGSDIFIMITGYFMVKSTFRIEKLMKLILQVFFYSMTIFVIFSAFGIIEFSFTALIKSFFPALFKTYWFFSAYILIYVLSPFINRYLNTENRKNHLILIIIHFAVIRVAPAIVSIVSQSTFESYGFTDLLLSYFIGAYLRLYPDNLLSKNKNAVISLIVCAVLLFSSVGAINIASGFFPALTSHYSFLKGRTSLLMIIISASLQTISVKTDIGEKKFINTVSSCTFGVYLIHDNPYIRNYLWRSILHVQDYIYSKGLILYIIFAAIAVFISCVLIDFIRQKTIEKPACAAIDAVCKAVRKKAVDLIDKKS